MLNGYNHKPRVAAPLLEKGQLPSYASKRFLVLKKMSHIYLYLSIYKKSLKFFKLFYN